MKISQQKQDLGILKATFRPQLHLFLAVWTWTNYMVLVSPVKRNVAYILKTKWMHATHILCPPTHPPFKWKGNNNKTRNSVLQRQGTIRPSSICYLLHLLYTTTTTPPPSPSTARIHQPGKNAFIYDPSHFLPNDENSLQNKAHVLENSN